MFSDLFSQDRNKPIIGSTSRGFDLEYLATPCFSRLYVARDGGTRNVLLVRDATRHVEDRVDERGDKKATRVGVDQSKRLVIESETRQVLGKMPGTIVKSRIVFVSNHSAVTSSVKMDAMTDSSSRGTW